MCGQSASRMRGQLSETIAQASHVDVIAVFELIEHPQDAVHHDLLRIGEIAERAVPRQKPPSTRGRDGECESVRSRQPFMLSTDDGGAPHLFGRQLFNLEASPHQSIAEITRQLAREEKIGHDKTER